MLQDVARYERLVHTRVLVALEVLQRVLGDALMLRGLCLPIISKLFRGAFSFRREQTVAGVLTFARRHVGMGGGCWERHEGLGEFINAARSSIWPYGGGDNCMQM